jgi:hypothetical protein
MIGTNGVVAVVRIGAGCKSVLAIVVVVIIVSVRTQTYLLNDLKRKWPYP